VYSSGQGIFALGMQVASQQSRSTIYLFVRDYGVVSVKHLVKRDRQQPLVVFCQVYEDLMWHGL